MEHRHHVRIPVGLKTLIYRRGVPVATGCIRDASQRGLFIETECRELLAHQRAQCELRIGAEQQAGGLRRVSVSVVRCSPEGAGVELDEGDGPVAQAMLAFLRQCGGT